MTTLRLASLRLRNVLWSGDSSSSFVHATYGLTLICLVGTALLIPTRPRLAALVAAVLFGWTEVDGLCGSSHVGTLTPLRLLSRGGALWLKSVSAYTLAGLITAGCAGLTIGWIGGVMPFEQPFVSAGVSIAIAALALILAARELRLIHFKLPQVRLQTCRAWSIEYGMITGAAMWGGHIGLAFATVVQHGGFFVIALLALTGGPAYASVLLAVYWLGRTLPMWFARILPLDQCTAPTLSPALLGNRAPYRHAAAIGLICCVAIALRMVS
jgi:hypothetical protein